MTAIPYRFQVKDSAGNPVTGLSPSWSNFDSYTSTPGTPVPITPQPSFTERGYGWYETSYDPYTNGEAFGRINLGNNLTANAGQYVDVSFTFGIPLQSQDIAAIAAAVFTQVVPETHYTFGTPSTYTFGAMINAIHQILYAFKFVGTVMSIFKRDGVTVAHTTATDDPTNPTKSIQNS